MKLKRLDSSWLRTRLDFLPQMNADSIQGSNRINPRMKSAFICGKTYPKPALRCISFKVSGMNEVIW